MQTGMIFDIKRFAVHDGPGIRTSVFLKGCPLKCTWCHNPEGISLNLQNIKTTTKVAERSFQTNKTIGRKVNSEIVMTEILKDKIFYKESKGGVTFSGGEPLLQADFLFELLTKCKEHNLHTTVDTCGYASIKELQRIVPITDLFLYDLKIIDDNLHKKFTGVSNNIIKENLQYLVQEDVEVIIRIPVIPTINDDDENIENTIRFLHNISFEDTIELLPFHNTANHKYRNLEIDNKIASLKDIDEKKINDIKLKFTQAGFVVK